MKKFFEIPEIDVMRFSVEDVITVSGGGDEGPGTGEDQTPWG